MSTNDLLFVEKGPYEISAVYLDSDYARDTLRVNKPVVEEIRRLRALRVSNWKN